jgi:SAM-dependent methyltransferase
MLMFRAANVGARAAMPDAPTSQLRDAMLARLYPEVGAVGFSRDDTTLVFYSQVNALLQPEMRVLDFGAGRGCSREWPQRYLSRLVDLKGKCREFVGYDVDPVVQTNPLLDRAVVGKIGEPLPFADGSFDLVVSRATFEHITDPGPCAAELGRVLRPGGWLCAWTPNRWGAIAVAARLVPEALHARALGTLQPERRTRDTFPTHYRMNTLATLERLFPAPAFRHASYSFSGQPTYHANRLWLARLSQLYEALMPAAGRRLLHVFIQKLG